MKFKLDENVPTEAAQMLRDYGYDAVTVHDQAMVSGPDDELARVCESEGRFLLTVDLGFANLKAFPLSATWAAVVIRARIQERLHMLSIIERFIHALESETLAGSLWIVTETEIRIRRSID